MSQIFFHADSADLKKLKKPTPQLKTSELEAWNQED